MKSFITAALLTTALLAAPVAQAASYQDRTMATGAVVGATAGAVVGSAQNQVVEGAVFGAILGTIAGVVIASQNEPVYVVHQPAAHHEGRRDHRPSYSRQQQNRHATSRGYDHERIGRH